MKLLINILFSISATFLLFDLYAQINKPKHFILSGGSFDQDINVIITEDTLYAFNYVKSITSAKLGDFNSRGVTFPSIDGNPVIIWLPNADDKSIIAHELFHATNDILTWAGIPFNEDTEEAYAYELQYITNQFYNHIK